MKKTKILVATAILSIATFVAIAADHIDAPATQSDSSSDITDFYAFQGADDSNIAFVANLQPLLGAGAATENATFDENVRDGKMYVFGPTAPSQPGLNSSIMTNSSNLVVVDITTAGESAIVESSGGIMAFAGSRDDPFFMDFNRYGEIIGGSATSFNNPGMDTFAGSNVMSVVVEVPKAMIGGSGTINTWVESKRKQ
jgi:hypothetical protein